MDAKPFGFYLFVVFLLWIFLFSGVSAALAAIQSHAPLVSSVTSHSARIWARSDSPATVDVEYATDPSLEAAVATASVETTAGSDFTAIFDLAGLAPSTRYYYRVRIDGIAAQVYPYPSFVTFPPEGSPADFSIGILADLENMAPWGYPEVSAPAYGALAADAPAFVLQIGDFDHRNPQTLTQMRNMRKSTRGAESASGEDWAREIAPRFPVYYVYDDHDYGINDGDKTWIGRADALQVYEEYFPTIRPNPSAGTWHKIVYGDVEIFMLDVRSQRDPNSSPDDASKSMLDGDNISNGQKEWLLKGLLISTARWKVLVSGVPFKSDSKQYDGWPAFSYERQELLDWITDYGIENAFIVSGDLHTGGAIDDGTYADLPELSVPHTNLPTNTVATGPAGQWSHGMTPGFQGGGYALLTFSSASGEVLLEVKDDMGNVRHSMTLQLEGLAQRFVDVTADAGIAPAANVIFSTSWFDFDGDNWVDLYLGKHLDGNVPGKEPNLWINQQDGTFADEFSTWFPSSIGGDTHGSQWVDFDNDGDMDFLQLTGAKGGGPGAFEANCFFVNEAGLYVDRAAEYGLDLPFGRGRDPIWFDFNRDGLLDALIANDWREDGLQWSALMEQGPGFFTDVASAIGLDFTDAHADSFRVSDLNADGFQDIVMLQPGYLGNRALKYFAGRADGSFDLQNGFLPDTGHVQDLVIGDFNGDQFNDVYIARAQFSATAEVRQLDNWTVAAVLRSREDELGLTFNTTGEVTFGFRKEQIRSEQVVPDRIYLGSEGRHPVAIPFSVRSTDPGIEGIQPHPAGGGDGLYIGYDSASDRWEVRYSDAIFRQIDFFLASTEAISDVMALEFASFDNVFLPDILLLFDPATGQLIEHTAGSGIPDVTSATSAVAADFDNDMDLDIYLAQETITAGLPDLLLVNHGNGTFVVEDVTATNQQPFGPHVAHFSEGTKAVSADYDNDGFVDLFLNGTKFPTLDVDYNGVDSQLLRNQGNANHWLEIELVGSQSPRAATGTRVWLTSGGVTQVRECDGGKHRVAKNDSRLHFGLGPRSTADELVVEWTSGRLETHLDVPADQVLTLVEGEFNSPPAFTQDPFTKKPASVGSFYQQGIGGDATDVDGDALVFSKVSGPAWLEVRPNGALRGTPSAGNVGTNQWTVMVEDGNGGSDTATMIIEVVITPSVLYRVNAGGPFVAATPNWEADSSQYVNTGNTASTSVPIDVSDPSLPAYLPAELLQTERWDSPWGPEMQWSFTVNPGDYEVRLYFAETYSGTQSVGARVFDVSIEGALVLDNYDVYADVGGYAGVMKAFVVTADTNLDIDFDHVVENPATKGIEIIELSRVLYRVNTGGPGLGGTPSWEADTSQYVNTGNTASTSVYIDVSDPSLPADVPQELLQTERWDPPFGPEMQWDFTVNPGSYEVRLYFAETYSGTQGVGLRVFDVSIEGALVLEDYDVYADVGGYAGVTKSFVVTTDANVDIDFGHVIENPAVKGIEIIELSSASQ